MSSAFNTDGMYGMPVIEADCLSSIEMAIAFDVRDWSEDRRSAWIYGIVHGWDDYDEIQEKFHWDNADIERLKKYHRQWCELKKSLSEQGIKNISFRNNGHNM